MHRGAISTVFLSIALLILLSSTFALAQSSNSRDRTIDLIERDLEMREDVARSELVYEAKVLDRFSERMQDVVVRVFGRDRLLTQQQEEERVLALEERQESQRQELVERIVAEQQYQQTSQLTKEMQEEERERTPLPTGTERRIERGENPLVTTFLEILGFFGLLEEPPAVPTITAITPNPLDFNTCNPSGDTCTVLLHVQNGFRPYAQGKDTGQFSFVIVNLGNPDGTWQQDILVLDYKMVDATNFSYVVKEMPSSVVQVRFGNYDQGDIFISSPVILNIMGTFASFEPMITAVSPNPLDFSVAMPNPDGTYNLTLTGENLFKPYLDAKLPSTTLFVQGPGQSQPLMYPFSFVDNNKIQITTEKAPTSTVELTLYNFVEGKLLPSDPYDLSLISESTAPPPGDDICTNYDYGLEDMKPSGYPSPPTYLLKQSWTWRRDLSTLDPAETYIVGGPESEFSTVKAALDASQGGETILVYQLSGGEKKSLEFKNRHFPDGQPVHIYFMQPMTMGPVTWELLMGFENVDNLVIDGMNNLKLLATDPNLTPDKKANPGAMVFFFAKPNQYPNRNIILKNMEWDGGYSEQQAIYDAMPNPAKPSESLLGGSGAKWGENGYGLKNSAFCNLYIHDIREEHAIYQHQVEGNWEVVASTFDSVGRTCLQHRHSWTGSTTAKVIWANNVCTNSCDGSGISAHDPGGMWWIYNNKVSKSVGGFASMDSTGDEADYGTGAPVANDHDHSDGRVYLFGNIFAVDQLPPRATWAEGLSPWGDGCKQFRPPFIMDATGGAKFYSQNNVLMKLFGGGGTNVYAKDPYTEWYDPTVFSLTDFAQSENNVLGIGGNPAWSPLVKWGDTFGKKPDELMFNQWQAKGYDQNSQMLYNQDAINYLNSVL